MKKMMIALLCLLISTTASTVCADMVDSDTWTQSSPYFWIGSGLTKTITHDFMDGETNPFDGWILDSFDLEFSAALVYPGSGGTVPVYAGGQVIGTFTTSSFGSYTTQTITDIAVESILESLAENGELTLTFMGSGYYVYLASSEMTVYGHTAVPVPGAMLLFGSGLVGLVGARRCNRPSKP